ncbi:MAG TPA: hypothetical protein VK177_04865 [Flavobacteriales bacterium]|nr:hypothetical protein [Flavobacteriales bacterium]
MNIFEGLTNEITTYLDISVKGLKKHVDVYCLDFTNGETDLAHLLCVKKEGVTEKEALILLIQRLLMVNEEWEDLDEYTRADLIRWTPQLVMKYKNSVFADGLSINNETYKAFVTKRLVKHDLKSILLNSEEISFENFININPMLNEPVLKLSKSEFKQLEYEFYMETEKHFLLYNWYTTA